MKNTFTKYYQDFPQFINSILESKPDYIVPVEKKGCKLLRFSHATLFDEIKDRIHYLQYFENSDIACKDKLIAIIDDATKYTSTLARYRKFFESMGAKVATYSFVGQEKLSNAAREKYDEMAHIYKFLDESTYQEYIIQQSQALASRDDFFDIDHFVIKTFLPKNEFSNLKAELNLTGSTVSTNDVYTPENLDKITFYNFDFYQDVPFVNHNFVSQGALKKIRICYNRKTEEMIIAPLAFPVWKVEGDDINKLFKDVPFEVPYEVSTFIKKSGIFINLSFVYHVSLLKAFLQSVNNNYLRKFYIINKDLVSYVGKERAEEIEESVQAFLLSEKQYDFTSNNLSLKGICEPLLQREHNFNSIIAILNELREVYNEIITDAHTVEGHNYFLSYREIVENYYGQSDIIKWMDILSDRGVLVARDWEQNGFFYRAYRSGEGDYDHIEKKTGILIPLAINICGDRNGEFSHIKSTFLNKILANLAYDFPNTEYDFHALFTKPYFFGPLTYVHDELNDEKDIPLYRFEEISRYYNYDEERNEFIAAITAKPFKEAVNEYFSKYNSVPISELTVYLDMLREIHSIFGTADALNAFAICRNEEIYYKYLYYNLSSALSNIKVSLRYLSVNNNEISEKYLREAGKDIKSAENKMSYNIKNILETFDNTIGNNYIYNSPYRQVRNSFIQFSNDFNANLLPKIKTILALEKATVNIYLFSITYEPKYFNTFFSLFESVPFELKKALDTTYLSTISEMIGHNKCKSINKSFIESIRKKISDFLYEYVNVMEDGVRINFPSPKSNDSEIRKKSSEYEATLNKATRFIQNFELNDFVILYVDYQGYRNVDKEKYIDISVYFQKYAKSLVEEFDGTMIYGIIGSDHQGIFILKKLEKTIQFVQQLFINFASNRDVSQVNLRMGISCANTVHKSLREVVRNAINEAEKLSKLWTLQFANCHDLVISSTSLNYLNEESLYMKNMFEKLGQIDKSNVGGDLYRFKNYSDFEPLNSVMHKVNQDERSCYGVVTVLPEECAAMRKMMDEVEYHIFPGNRAGNEFWIGKIKGLNGKAHNIVLAQTLQQGNNSAAVRVMQLLNHFPNMKSIIMTGIAAGVPDLKDFSNHVRLGDVVVSSSIVAFDHGKLKDGVLEPRNDEQKVDALFIQAYHRLRQKEIDGNEFWNTYILCEAKEKFAKPDMSTDVLHDINGKIIDHPKDPTRNSFPKIFEGKIATSDKLLRDAKFRDELKNKYGVFAIEMEASGISEASWENSIGYFVVRASSDYGDRFKADGWHYYAALTAAAYTRALFENVVAD